MAYKYYNDEYAQKTTAKKIRIAIKNESIPRR